MPISRHSTVLRHVQIAPVADIHGVTELRVHGVSGTPADALLGDLAPELVWGDQAAGFYRSADHDAGDPGQRPGVSRHVEAYSWGGLTSGSSYRVLWLALLPFLLGNLSGWMCSARTRESRWRFAWHRAASGLSSLALTVNTALAGVAITAGVLGYEAPRAGLAKNQKWLIPLGWLAGHPARQVTLGVLVAALLAVALRLIVGRSWRYEDVRPPYVTENVRPPHVTRKQPGRPRTYPAAALDGGLRDPDFWDSGRSVRLLTRAHVAAFTGFLAIVGAVTTRALASGPEGWAVMTLWWIAVVAGVAALAGAAGYLIADAIAGVPKDGDGRARDVDAVLAHLPLILPWVGLAGLVAAAVSGWYQPAASPAAPHGPAALPGLASLAAWTALGIAVTIGLLAISVLLGLGRDREAGAAGNADPPATMWGGGLASMLAAFGLLNALLLCLQAWVAHLVGPVSVDADQAVAKSQIYLPHLVEFGGPLMAWALVAAVVAFGLVEIARWLLTRHLPPEVREAYSRRAREYQEEQSGEPAAWYWSPLAPYALNGDGNPDPKNTGWERKVARARLADHSPYDAAWLLWGIVVLQFTAGVAEWRTGWEATRTFRDIGIFLASLILPALMLYLRAAWGDVSKRRTIGVLWDVGTFWPRAFHPFAPPCYSEQAVPDLQRRLWWLHDNSGAVVLIAHSQGAMLASAALTQTGRRAPAQNPEAPVPGDHAALVTFGNPLCRLYAWAFPGYIDRCLARSLAPGGDARVVTWLNFFYPTDPIGGPVGGLLEPGDASLVDQPASKDAPEAGSPDPAECWYVYGTQAPAPGGHSGYWADRRVWDGVDKAVADVAAAAGIAVAPVPSQRSPESTPSLVGEDAAGGS